MAFYPVVANSNLMLVTVEGFYDDDADMQQRLTANVMVQNAQGWIHHINYICTVMLLFNYNIFTDHYQILTDSQGHMTFDSRDPSANATWLIQNEDPSSK